MADLLFIAVTIAFFGVAVLLVKACDRIVGPDGDRAPDAVVEPLEAAPKDKPHSVAVR